MVTIRQERRSDVPAREALLEAAFGASRFAKAAERLREGRVAADGMAFVAIEHGQLVGTVRLWHVGAGRGRPALLLGPLAVAADARNRGIGTALMRRALRQARRQGCRAVLLVGDAPFYGRFGFSAEKTAALWLPGPYERHRLLGCELVAGSLDDARGLIAQSGRQGRKPKLTELIVNLGSRNGAAAAQPL
jgi:predicted N-acetyltransferase YhbS